VQRRSLRNFAKEAIVEIESVTANKKKEALEMKSKNIPAIVIVVAILAFLGSMAISAQDKYTLQVPNGLAFSDFRGYENWQVVAVSQTEDLLKVMVANPTMIDAYRAGIPLNGKPFPDGSKIAKIE
jgi:hypothetical protein